MRIEDLTLFGLLLLIGVTLFVTVITDYLRMLINWALSKISVRWNDRVEREEATYQASLERHLHNPELVLITGFKWRQRETRAFFYILFGVLAALGEHIVLIKGLVLSREFFTLPFTATVYAAAFFNLWKAAQLSRLLDDVQKKHLSS